MIGNYDTAGIPVKKSIPGSILPPPYESSDSGARLESSLGPGRRASDGQQYSQEISRTVDSPHQHLHLGPQRNAAGPSELQRLQTVTVEVPQSTPMIAGTAWAHRYLKTTKRRVRARRESSDLREHRGRSTSPKDNHHQAKKHEKTSPEPPARATRPTQTCRKTALASRKRQYQEFANENSEGSRTRVLKANGGGPGKFAGDHLKRRRGAPRMDRSEVKLVLGFDKQTNRAYDCLCREVRTYMEDMGIDHQDKARPEVWQKLMDWVSGHRYLDRHRLVYNSPTLGKNVRLAIHIFCLNTANTIRRSRRDRDKNLENTSFFMEREDMEDVSGDYGSGNVAKPSETLSFTKWAIIVTIFDPDKVGDSTGGTFDLGRGSAGVVKQYPTMLKKPDLNGIFSACKKHLPEGRTPRAIYGSTKRQCLQVSAGGGGDALILTDDDEVESWLMDAGVKGLNSLAVIAVLHRGGPGGNLKFAREDSPLSDSGRTYIKPRDFNVTS